MRDLEELEAQNRQAQLELEAAVKKGEELMVGLRDSLTSKISKYEDLLQIE